MLQYQYDIISNGVDLSKRLQIALEEKYPKITWKVEYPTSWPPDQHFYIDACFIFDRSDLAYRQLVDTLEVSRSFALNQYDELLQRIAFNAVSQFSNFLLSQ